MFAGMGAMLLVWWASTGFWALGAMAIAFGGIWLFSKTDTSARAEIDKAGFEPQYVRSETGIGAFGAVAH